MNNQQYIDVVTQKRFSELSGISVCALDNLRKKGKLVLNKHFYKLK